MNDRQRGATARERGIERSAQDTFAGRAFYEACKAGVVVVFKVWLRLRREAADNVPRRGAVLLVANHQSYLDPPLVGAMAPRPLRFVARGTLFRNRAFAWLISALGALPIKQDGGDVKAMKVTLSILERGGAVLLFPEGKRTPDGRMRPFKRGTAVLLKRAQCPVIPVALEGVFDAWPRHQRLPRWRGVRTAVRFGAPIDHDELLKDGADAGLARLAREIDAMRLDLREELRRRSGGKYPPKSAGDDRLKPASHGADGHPGRPAEVE